MALIEWQDDYSVGVRKLDDQHKKMFDLINRLFEQMQAGEEMKSREDTLKELTEYARYHLATEEKYFEQFDYPQKQEHVNSHNSYREKIKSFITRKDDALLSFEIIDFLEDWWLGHVTSVDKEYKDFFNQHGLK